MVILESCSKGVLIFDDLYKSRIKLDCSKELGKEGHIRVANRKIIA
jgi:hypothetical protein